MSKKLKSLVELACKDCGTITKPRIRFGDTRWCKRCAVVRGLLTEAEADAIINKPKKSVLDDVDEWRPFYV